MDLICERPRRRARETPGAVFLIAPGREAMTYGDLGRRLAAARAALRAAGLGRADRVAAVLPTGPEQIAVHLALMESVVAVPLPEGLTEDALAARFAEARVAAVVVPAEGGGAARRAAAACGARVLALVPDPAVAGGFALEGGGGETPLPGDHDAPVPGDDRPARPDDLAAVMFTSGTTARPKRVPLTHANLTAACDAYIDWFGITAADRMLNTLSCAPLHGLKGSVLVPAACGASVIAEPGFEAGRFLEAVRRWRPTVFSAVPAIHQSALEAVRRGPGRLRPSPFRLLHSGSAPMAPDLLRALEDAFDAPVLEAYGLTETSAGTFGNPLPPGPRKPGGVGPSLLAEAAVADEAGRRLPQGEVGEVIVRGPVVFAGYEDDPEATAAAFFGDWFRTGDLGRFDADGHLFLTGRLKEMINRGGEKIAPVEIDHALMAHPDVARALAFAVPHPTLGEDVGAAVVAREGATLDLAALRAFAAARLGQARAPAHLRVVEALPLNAAGKPMRRGLAERLGVRVGADAGRAEGASGGTDAEAEVARIWAQAFGLPSVGLDDDFFALGGDSLAATALALRVSEALGADLPVSAVFDGGATPRAMARMAGRPEVDAARARRGDPAAEAVPDPAPASLTQQSIWLAARMLPDRPVFHVPAAVRLIGPLEAAAVARAAAAMAARHPALTTGFALERGRLVQRPGAGEPTPVATETPAPGEGAEAWAARRAAEPFDLAAGRVWRCALLREGPERHVLLVAAHHAVIDGRGLEVLLEELLRALAGEALPPAPPPTTRFAAWQRRCAEAGLFDGELARLARTLEAGPALRGPPPDRPRPPGPAAEAIRLSAPLPAGTAEALRRIAAERRATPFMALLAGYGALMHAETGAARVAVGVPNANRPAAFDRTVGCFTNTPPCVLDLSGDPAFGALVERARAAALEAHALREAPVELAARAFGPAPGAAEGPWLAATVQLSTLEAGLPETAGPLRVEPVGAEPAAISLLDAAFDWRAGREGLTLHVAARADLYEAATAARWLSESLRILEAAAADPDLRLSALG